MTTENYLPGLIDGLNKPRQKEKKHRSESKKGEYFPPGYNITFITLGKVIGPYVGVNHEMVVRFAIARRMVRRFYLFTYCRFDEDQISFGELTGHRRSGIAVYDVNNEKLVCDGIANDPDSPNLVSDRQVTELKRIAKLDWESFRVFLSGHPRSRYAI